MSAKKIKHGNLEASREDIGNLLRAGVALAATLVIVGGVLYLAHASSIDKSAHFSSFQGEPAQLRSISSIIFRALHGDAKAIIEVGILALIATPIARVIAGLLLFVRLRDWIYVAISCIVLSLLLWSVFYG